MTSFAAVFWNEVLLNTKRVAPYVLMILFSANATLWWGWGPAVELGWATNSDYYIVRNLGGFSFLLGLPIFNAVIMGDPVIRDFRLGVDPLIFSKPINRAQYLFGKFIGSFFVLVCCQSVFTLTLLVLQAFRRTGMVVQPVKVFPYFKHFFFFVVISHLVLAAFYFSVGTLTRNTKIVYALAVCFYPLYISYGLLVLRRLPVGWRTGLDPFMLTLGKISGGGFDHSAEFLNSYVVQYSSNMIANRAVMVLITIIILTILCFRFAVAEKSEKVEKVEKITTLSLSTAAERVYYDSDSFQETYHPQIERAKSLKLLPLPSVTRTNAGFRSAVEKFIAALSIEFRLLRAERSLVVLMPLAIFLSSLDLAFYPVVPEVSYSATYASGTAKALLLFLVGMTIFYTGEAIYRDREVRIEPVLWATPAPNSVLLFSKWLAILLLALSLMALLGLTAIVVQLLRGHTPVDISAYFLTYVVILVPSIIFLTGVCIALAVLLRNKYVSYVAGIGISAGLFYLYSIGYNHWLYNPLLYGLWNYADLTGAGNNQTIVLWHRLYCIAIAVTALALAHLFFQRKSMKRILVAGRLSGIGLSLVVASVSLTMSVIIGVVIATR